MSLIELIPAIWTVLLISSSLSLITINNPPTHPHPPTTKSTSYSDKMWTILGMSNITSDLYQSDLTCGARKKSTTTWLPGTFQYTTKTHLGQKGRIQKCLPHSTLQILCQHRHLRADQIEKKMGWDFAIKIQVCCKSHNLVYCLTCKICGQQYVGHTKRTFYERLYEHLRDIQNKDLTKPLGHFALPDHTPDTTQVTSHILAFITKPSNTSAAKEMRLRIELHGSSDSRQVYPVASMLWSNSLDTPLIPAVIYTSKSSSNWHVHGDWYKTSGNIFRKWPKTRILIILGPKNWASEAHILHTSKSHCNEYVKQY